MEKVTNGKAIVGSLAIRDKSTATAAAGAATLSKQAGTITTETLNTAAGAEYTLTLTNTLITTSAQVFASVQNGGNTTAGATVTTVAPGSGSVVIKVKNTHASAALDGTLKISFLVIP